MKSSRVVTALFAIVPFFAHGQFSKPLEKFPADDERYLYPIYPGQPGSLAGTMGELRSTHFHSGIDIRTNNMIGLPVRASKSGYISRISMTASGYGNVIYITHRDGNTTLYAHLDEFLGPLAKHVRQEQYAKKTSEIDLYFTEDQFKVKQGDTIALSGNSGGSTGPHLHFDIRDPENFALDPLKVAGFPELIDKFPPAAEKIALKTMDINSRINDRFGRFEFYAQRVGNNYVITSPILATGNIGVELVAKDKLASQSQFFGGVNYIEMRVDSQVVFNQAIERLNVAETRTIYTLMDFKTMRNKGTRFYKLYIDDGNDLKFYGASPGTGKISVNPAKESAVQIKMKDSDGNASTLSFRLKPSALTKDVISLEPYISTELTYDVSENTMLVIAKPCKETNNLAQIFTKGTMTEIEPAYFNANRAVYLLDLRKGIPDSVGACRKMIAPKISISIPSGTEYKYYSNTMDIEFPMNAIYDTLYLNTDYVKDASGQELFTIGTRTVPLNKSISVSLKPGREYVADKKLGVYRTAGKGYTYLGGEWINGRIAFNTRELGDFTILKDIEAPSIRVVSVNKTSARFKIKDNLSGISNFEANIDGKWLLMMYDSKSATIWSERLDNTVPLKGMLELVVTDNAGNKSTYRQKIL
ncbi:M23 family metallopeptidase [Chryseolinea lacunae]|uniref:M23 family metallopeptidase n=1 Tax=Chryseolinea lacunae TaxID=2801331 RepID=A0ABS1KWA7_9BACT|nr:M23 family metallopeptidase [Chryseolinea lacunae]MBL0743588.1 M23 family metallopeptidase [Chryseolinea lacunae]